MQFYCFGNLDVTQKNIFVRENMGGDAGVGRSITLRTKFDQITPARQHRNT